MGYLLDDDDVVLLDELDEELWDEFGPTSTDPDPEPVAAVSYPWVRLEAPGVAPLTFDQSAGWYVDRLDLGSVDKRDTSQEIADGNGTIDPSSLIGARDVLLAGTMVPDVAELWQMREALAAFESQRIRCTITWQESATAPVRMVRRARAVQIPGRVTAAPADAFRAVFRVERGVIEAAAQSTAIVYASGSGIALGRTYPLTHPRIYPQAPPVGATTITNAGKFDAAPVLRVFGPCAGLRIENRTLDRALVFVPDFAVNAGEYLEIDTTTRTIRLDSDPTQSRQSRLDFADTRWWWLAPGPNDVRFVPDTYTPGARVEVAWHHTWLG